MQKLTNEVSEDQLFEEALSALDDLTWYEYLQAVFKLVVNEFIKRGELLPYECARLHSVLKKPWEEIQKELTGLTELNQRIRPWNVTEKELRDEHNHQYLWALESSYKWMMEYIIEENSAGVVKYSDQGKQLISHVLSPFYPAQINEELIEVNHIE